MTAQKWQAAWQIYLSASAIAPGERDRFLNSLDSDPDILEQVLLLLQQPEDLVDAPPPLPVPIPPPGSRIGRYELLACLGRGGVGTVYSARDRELGRIVALKFLSPETFAAGSTERVIREAQTLSSLNHPNIVTVYEIIEHGSTFAIAMELIDGEPLRALCNKPLASGQVIRIGIQIAQALAAAHAQGIVHRDIKPENILIRRDGYVKVLDFGLARSMTAEDSTASGLPVGTLRYMPPERIRGEPVSPAGDIFSFGLVLYELALPFDLRSGRFLL